MVRCAKFVPECSAKRRIRRRFSASWIAAACTSGLRSCPIHIRRWTLVARTRRPPATSRTCGQSARWRLPYRRCVGNSTARRLAGRRDDCEACWCQAYVLRWCDVAPRQFPSPRGML